IASIGLFDSVALLRCLPHLRHPAVPAPRGARTGARAGGGSIPGGNHRHHGVDGGAGDHRILARRTAEMEARLDGGRRGLGHRAGVSGRVNIYELMFHPLIHPSFTAARDVKLNGAEMVIAVRNGAEARAYPIRSMSYHHVVNDVLGGAASVATY